MSVNLCVLRRVNKDLKNLKHNHNNQCLDAALHSVLNPCIRWKWCGPGSSVSTAAELWAGRSRVEPQWGQDFPAVQTDPGAHPASCTMGTGSFPGVKCSQGLLLTTHPLLVPRSWKSRAIPLPTLWATPGL